MFRKFINHLKNLFNINNYHLTEDDLSVIEEYYEDYELDQKQIEYLRNSTHYPKFDW